MILIKEIQPNDDFTIKIVFEDSNCKLFDLKPYLNGHAFKNLKEINNFKRVVNRGYYIEWYSGQDISSDTLYFD